jgi:hypothetical protein
MMVKTRKDFTLAGNFRKGSGLQKSLLRKTDRRRLEKQRSEKCRYANTGRKRIRVIQGDVFRNKAREAACSELAQPEMRNRNFFGNGWESSG